MSGIINAGGGTNPAVIAKYHDKVEAKPIVIDAAAGVNGALLIGGTIMTQQGSGRYLPAVSGDSVTIGQTCVLLHTVQLDGTDAVGYAGIYGGYLNKPQLIGTPAQIAALGPEIEPGVVVMKQW